MKRIFIILFAFFLFINLSYSQIPQTISWQGIIEDNEGNNLTGNHNITVKLFEVATGGNQIWTELHTAVDVENGLVNLSLGSVTPLNISFDKQYWLEITVGESTPLPRIKLNSVPYSLYSAKTSGIIANDSIVLKDSLGLTRMVFNPNTGTFKMMDNDTVWYEVSVNSPSVTTIMNPDGSYSKKSGENQWDYDSNDNLIYKKEVTGAGGYVVESWLDDGYMYKRVRTIEASTMKDEKTECFHQEDGVTKVLTIIKQEYKQPTLVDGIEEVVSKTEIQKYNLGEDIKTFSVFGETEKGYYREEYYDGNRQQRSVTTTNDESVIEVKTLNTANGIIKEEYIQYHNETSAEIRSVKKEYLNDILKEKTEWLADGKYKVYRYNPDGSLINGGLFTGDGQLVSAWDDSQNGITTKTTPNGFSVGRYFPSPGVPVCNVGPTWDNSGFIVGYKTYNGDDRANMVFGYNDVGINTSPTGNIQLNSNTSVTGNANVSGNANVTGNLNVSGTKNFLIEHPTQTDKYLVHAAIESNEVLNQYSGNVMTNAEGLTTITLPDYFNDINVDFRYQLTIIGASFARAIVFEEINKNNQFTIKTDEPNIKVSWQVTAKRNDKYLREHPFFEIRDKE